MAHAKCVLSLLQSRSPAPIVGSSALRNRKTAVRNAFLEHQDVLLKWLTKTLGDRETAQDIAQAAFLNLWVYADRRSIQRPKSLLFKTAGNLARNELRRRRRFSKRNVLAGEFADVDNQLASPANDPSPEDIATLRQQAALILRLIDELPARQRTAFRLHRFNNMSYKEIAAKIGVSESSVGKYIMEALKSLRRSLL